MFGVLYAAEGSAPGAAAAVAREFSPRIEILDPAREVVIDLAGLTRLFGDAQTLAGEVRRTAADRGLQVRVAVAGTRTAARLLVRHRAGLSVTEPGGEARAVAPLPIERLSALQGPDASSGPHDPDLDALVVTLRRWGLRTLGELAALPPGEVAARLGQSGVRWQRVACGEDLRPLVPSAPEERFEQALDLEWPIEGLEPLSFVLGRLLEPLSAHLDRRGRGAAVLHVRLHLVTRALHERSLQLPVAMREARTLRTLLLLDLESHPPPAAIDRVVVAVDPTPARVVQFSLLTRPLPSPEQLSTLMARLQALMGETRCGAPVPVDSWEPGAFAMAGSAFAVRSGAAGSAFAVGSAFASGFGETTPIVALRRYRVPVIARVREEGGRPVRVTADRAGAPGGRVVSCSGPWRTSGAWWVEGGDAAAAGHGGHAGRTWDRDEWDVTVSDGATCRIFRERDTARWFVEGIID
jgi:protein ImuB